ncbi:MAG: DEAD/DEAH box helicase [Proteobacteria bacterium]|nr:DEAD/DEAH box helicase [Pseudomonadota bacterium]MBU1386391.1 DEAD/DEAH box helicase [Pseudomonadota bacterium]MBU1544502.1 DEAD/DEAH box helicase [Pseudomonadota bacterium]MBU2429177.1 DEAD/DEAH box helicase [Pseudomonadota bacterium]MBU2480424.1 DEAD/DEAH box helicase [Pseudomonadota bacterium]
MKQFISFIKSLFTLPKQKTAAKEKPLPDSAEKKCHPLQADPEINQTPLKVPEEKTRPKNTPDIKKWSVNDFPVEPQKGMTRFHDLNLPATIMHAIADLDFKYCTPVQAELLIHTLEGKDATAKAQTGTGKSASFILTMLNAFLKKPGKNPKGFPRALILAPTRELVHQIEKDFMDLARYTPLKIIAIYGGTGYQKQQVLLKQKPVDVIVATPGRLIDFMSKRLIDVSKVEIAVIDEADRMLDMGFVPDVRKIILKTPHKKHRQTLFFSATLSPEVLRLAESWTTDNVVRIEITPEQTAADGINQIVYITTEKDKFKNVYNLINNEQLQRVIIFVNRKDTSRFLSEKFHRYGQKCSILSGDVAQDKRFKVLDDFKNGKINILIATDVAARGLHIEDISHVINYDLPTEPEHYIHRIGRTGRAGALGTSISFADEMSSFFIPQIEAVLGNKIICEYPSDELDKALPKPNPHPSGKKAAPGPGPGNQSRKKPPYKKRKKPAYPNKNQGDKQ